MPKLHFFHPFFLHALLSHTPSSSLLRNFFFFTPHTHTHNAYSSH